MRVLRARVFVIFILIFACGLTLLYFSGLWVKKNNNIYKDNSNVISRLSNNLNDVISALDLSKSNKVESIDKIFDIEIRRAPLHTPSQYFEIHGIENREEHEGDVRILCWITSFPARFRRAKAAQQAWGKHCNIFVIMSSKQENPADVTANVVYLNTSSSYGNLWQRTQLAFLHLWDNYRGKFDFMLKADDDTYVSYPSLVKFLSDFDPEQSLYLGQPFHKSNFGTYMSGGAGYVMSASAFENLIRGAFLEHRHDKGQGHKGGKNKHQVESSTWRGSHHSSSSSSGILDFLTTEDIPEDAAVGLCMSSLTPANSTPTFFVAALDERNLTRFIPDLRDDLIETSQDEDHWYRTLTRDIYFVDGRVGGEESCCSEDVITEHYVKTEEMMRRGREEEENGWKCVGGQTKGL